MDYSEGGYERLIHKIEAKYKEIYSSISDASIICFYRRTDDDIWIKASYCDRKNGFGRYNIKVNIPWINKFMEAGGEYWELKFLVNYQLFRTVKKVHGAAITEQVYKPYINLIENAVKFSYGNGLEATTPNIPWKPWGSEFEFPLEAFLEM